MSETSGRRKKEIEDICKLSGDERIIAVHKKYRRTCKYCLTELLENNGAKCYTCHFPQYVFDVYHPCSYCSASNNYEYYEEEVHFSPIFQICCWVFFWWVRIPFIIAEYIEDLEFKKNLVNKKCR